MVSYRKCALVQKALNQIALVSYRDGNAEIYVMIRLANSSAHEDTPTWSPVTHHSIYRRT